MRDKSHEEQIKRWAEYVKNNPNWKLKFRPFLDSQIIIARKIYKKLSMTPRGKEKIKLLRNIK